MWITQPAADWDEWVSDAADALSNDTLHDVVEQFNLVPSFAQSEGVTGAVHEGALHVVGDFKQPKLLAAVQGDLTVDGMLSTQEIDGWDGNATLVVFGDLHCSQLINDWASLIIVTGDCTVTDWTFIAREDSAFIVGGDFTTPFFVGADIWASVGGRAEMDAGYGYALDLNSGGPVVRPAKGWHESALQLGLPAKDEEAFMIALETRLHETGSIRL